MRYSEEVKLLGYCFKSLKCVCILCVRNVDQKAAWVEISQILLNRHEADKDAFSNWILIAWKNNPGLIRKIFFYSVKDYYKIQVKSNWCNAKIVILLNIYYFLYKIKTEYANILYELFISNIPWKIFNKSFLVNTKFFSILCQLK